MSEYALMHIGTPQPDKKTISSNLPQKLQCVGSLEITSVSPYDVRSQDASAGGLKTRLQAAYAVMRLLLHVLCPLAFELCILATEMDSSWFLPYTEHACAVHPASMMFHGGSSAHPLRRGGMCGKSSAAKHMSLLAVCPR